MLKDPIDILKPYPLNSQLTLKNRIVMAPMTRVNATKDFVPTENMIHYYTRRASAGLIVTEGTIIHAHAGGNDCLPGIFNTAQVDAWRRITDSVHAQQGLIFNQIWHVGRVSHPVYLDGNLPVSCSETSMTGRVPRGAGLMYGKCRAMTEAEILQTIDDFRQAAKNAKAAGFDGVEIHGANGYLIDQFLHYHTNFRQDQYGGSPENMARFCLAIVKACGDVWGYERVGLRLSPGTHLNEIVGDPRDAAVFQYLLSSLSPLPIAYVHMGNFDDSVQFPALGNVTMTAFVRANYPNTLIACGGYSFARATDGISAGEFDLVAIGRPFIANPDLIARFQQGQALNVYNSDMLKTLY